MSKICPSCGKREGEGVAFAGAFCARCYARRERVFELPEKLDLRVCPRCERAFLQGEWRAFSEDELKRWLLAKIKSRLPLSSASVYLHKAKNGFNAELVLVFDAEGARVDKTANAFVRVASGLCDSCLKRSSGYHEALFQLRGSDAKRLRALAKRLIRACERTSFVTGYEERREGIDFLVGDRSAAMKAVNESGRCFTLSHKLIGVRDGKRVFRATVCIRV